MTETARYCENISGVSDIIDNVVTQREQLRKEVEKYCGERGVAAS